jgi:hypothetical protein
MDLTIEECEQLLLQYCKQEEEEEEVSCKHNFVNDICVNCGEETEGITINYERIYYTKPKFNTMLSLMDLRNLNLDDYIVSSIFEMYKQVVENNIFRAKFRKSVLCVCICTEYVNRKNGLR